MSKKLRMRSGRSLRRSLGARPATAASASPRIAERRVDLVVAHQERRRHADGVGPHRVDQQAVGSGPRPPPPWPPAPRAGPPTAARPRAPRRRRAASASPAEPDAPPSRARRQTSSDSMTASVALTAARASGWPPKVEPWSPGPNAAATSARAQQAPDRHAVAQRLGHRHHVGLEALGLEGEPVPGAAEAGLHLVEHEQRVALGAQRPHRAQVVRARDHDAALALERLEQDGGHRVRVERLVERGDVVVGHVHEPLGQREERRLLLGLARWR